MLASQREDVEIVRLLVASPGIDVNMQNEVWYNGPQVQYKFLLQLIAGNFDRAPTQCWWVQHAAVVWR